MIIEKTTLPKPSDIISSNSDSSLLEKLEDYIVMQQQYNAAIREVTTKLTILDEEFHVRYDHSPIHHIESRLKTPQSIIGKLKRKGFDVNLESIREHLMDVAGVRVICCYIDDVYRIADMLLKQDDVTLLRVSDYIKKPKDNGYRSLHIVVTTPIFLSERKEYIPVEIQLRTVAMDFWASLEHQIHYKNEKEVPEELIQRLKVCADDIAKIDGDMQNIYNQIH